MTKIKVLPLQEKSWQDKKFWEVQVDHNGEVIKASIWPPHGYTFEVGKEQEIDGDLAKNDKGYWSIKCGNMGPKPASLRGAGMEKVMEKKQIAIRESMDRKELSILLSQANTFATEMTKTFFGQQPFLSDADWRNYWQEQKMWFLAHHATEEEYQVAIIP